MAPTTLDRIKKQVHIRAPRARVWRAITNIEEFSRWFGVEADGPFAPGQHISMVSTNEGCKGAQFYVDVQEIEPERLFSWRWYPGLMEPGIDPLKEHNTLVTFTLEDAEGGTLVTVTESGFDHVTLKRRAKVYEENEAGWAYQMASLERYVGANP